MSLSHTVVRMAEEAHHSEAAVNPWLVGGVILGGFVFALLALIAFGGGRDHS